MGCYISTNAPTTRTKVAARTTTTTTSTAEESAKGVGQNKQQQQKEPNSPRSDEVHFGGGGGGYGGGLPQQSCSSQIQLAQGSLLSEFACDVKDCYTIQEQIGQGSISNIYLVHRKVSDHQAPKLTTTTATTSSYNARYRGKQEGTIDPTFSASSYSTTPQQSGGAPTTPPPPPPPPRPAKMECYALKEIDLSLVEPGHVHDLKRQINLLKTIDHPNVLKAHEVYDASRNNEKKKKHASSKISIIMEYCSGGDLHRHIPCRTEGGEQRVKVIVTKIVEAVHYLHLRGIMHRDIRPENIMFESAAPNAEVKLIGFGLAQQYGNNKRISKKDKKTNNNNTSCGGGAATTTIYSTKSPEAIRGDNYDKPADIWSIGVVTYMLLVGDPPFWGSNQHETEIKIMTGQYDSRMNGPNWKEISAAAKHFIRQCLQVQPIERQTAEQALQSSWLSDTTAQKLVDLRRPSSRSVLRQLTNTAAETTGPLEAHKGQDNGDRNNNNGNDDEKNNNDNGTKRVSSKEMENNGNDEALDAVESFRKLVLLSIAHKASASQDADILKLRQVFHSLDTDHNGTLSLNEVLTGLRRAGLLQPSPGRISSSRSNNSHSSSHSSRASLSNPSVTDHVIEKWFERANVIDKGDQGGGDGFGGGGGDKASRIDHGGEPEISYTEFIAAYLDAQARQQQEQQQQGGGGGGQGLLQRNITEAFYSMDLDHSGTITKENLRDSLVASGAISTSTLFDSDYVEQVLLQADMNGDGCISFEEFQAVVVMPQQIVHI